MGARYILDTNIIIYYLKGQMSSNIAAFIEERLFLGNPNLSVITEIELLGWKSASDEQIEVLKDFIKNSNVLELNENIKNKAIEVRRNYKIKLPDALIAATALVHDFELITRNTKDFENIAGLKIKNPWD
ncbi:MAG: type II toxin-antitoxin system VapC family toxin [Fibromonadaceae bacterium]|jgi:predicted nucleic acid-binding protein|nr:type II toxin-antitoxin system VapC family toxin [Fibromonadaceae bacterium]